MSTDLDSTIVDAAIAWRVRLQYGHADARQQAAFEAWRSARPEHDAAWRRLNALDARFDGISPELALNALSASAHHRAQRRKAIKALAWVGAVGVGAWFARNSEPWQRIAADYSTATGERRTVHLADGTTLVLNTASALDVRFAAGQREIRLRRGELYVQTGRDTAAPIHRPFYVQTAFGRLQALGTRFAVRLDASSARVGVDEGAVEIAPPDGPTAIAHAGEVYRFDRTSVRAVDAPASATMNWLDGVIVAHAMPLADFLRELSRYRTGIVRCTPAIAQMPVSGTFQTADTDRTLAFLADHLHLAMDSHTRYWITLSAAGR
jgi:transmembrane sensor